MSRKNTEVISVYVGNLPYGFNNKSLFALANGHCSVKSARIIREHEDSTKSRGFGFVKVRGRYGAKKLIKRLDGKECHGRKLKLGFA